MTTHQNNLMAELRDLTEEDITLEFNKYDQLVAALPPDETRRRVSAVRCFPLTYRDKYIVLRDDNQEEIGLVSDLAKLSGDSRSVLETYLERAYLIPTITKIERISVINFIPTWRVQTDRGPRRIEIRSGRNDILALDGGRVFIRDADGNQYEVPDRNALDPASRAMLDAHV